TVADFAGGIQAPAAHRSIRNQRACMRFAAGDGDDVSQARDRDRKPGATRGPYAQLPGDVAAPAGRYAAGTHDTGMIAPGRHVPGCEAAAAARYRRRRDPGGKTGVAELTART